MRGLSADVALGKQQVGDWRVDGLVVAVGSEQLREWIESVGIPVINVVRRLDRVRVATVAVDDVAVGEMAANHLLERGFASLAFVGSRSDAYAAKRHAAFARRATANGIGCAAYWGESLDPAGDPPLATWLRSLPPATAILAADDRWAIRACEVARESDISIPDRVALLGVDDDEMAMMTFPPLSSVRVPSEQIGFEAARLLDQMMGRKPVASQTTILLEPSSITERQSTDRIAIDDAEVSAAVRFIREHACEAIDVESILDIVPLSRRRLEQRFRHALGRTPLEEIRRVRLMQAKKLLAETTLAISQIAAACGFSSAQRMAVVFREIEHESPTDYRLRFVPGVRA
jgi:LacI family transcriptional regulator